MKPWEWEVPKMEIGKEKEVSRRTLSPMELTTLPDFLYDSQLLSVSLEKWYLPRETDPILSFFSHSFLSLLHLRFVSSSAPNFTSKGFLLSSTVVLEIHSTMTTVSIAPNIRRAWFRIEYPTSKNCNFYEANGKSRS